MKFALFVLVIFALATVVVAQPQPTSTTTPTTPTEDPIIADYMKKLTELYTKAIIDYYHAHPERVRVDLSMLTTAEYETLVPPSLITEFHLNGDEIASKLGANDATVYHTSQADLNDEMEINAIPSTTADSDDHDRAHPHQFDAQVGKEGLGLYGASLYGGSLGLGLGVGGIGSGYPVLGGLGLGLGYPGVGLGIPGVGLGFGYPLGGVGFGGAGLGLGYGGLGYGVGLGLGWGRGLGLAVI